MIFGLCCRVHDDTEAFYRSTLPLSADLLIITSHSPVPVLLYHYSSFLRRSSQLLEERKSANFRLDSSPYLSVIKHILFSHQQYCSNNMTHLVLYDETSKRIWLLVFMVYISGFVYPNDMHNRSRQWRTCKLQPSGQGSSSQKTCVPSDMPSQTACPRSLVSTMFFISLEDQNCEKLSLGDSQTRC